MYQSSIWYAFLLFTVALCAFKSQDRSESLILPRLDTGDILIRERSLNRLLAGWDDLDDESIILPRLYSRDLLFQKYLSKRKDAEDGPLDHIKLEKAPGTPDTMRVMGDDGQIRDTPCFGSYCAHGAANGKVTQQQFVQKTEELAKQVKEKWDAAPDEQKYKYEKAGSDDKGDFFKKPASGEKITGPMSGGQATGTGDHVKFDFATQNKPLNDLEHSQKAKNFFKETENETIRKADPNFNQATHDKAIADAKDKAKAANDESRKHFEASKQATDPAEKQKLMAQKKESDKAKVAATKEAGDLTAQRNKIETQSGHQYGNQCAECKLMSQTVDKHGKEELSGGWQQAYGWRGKNSEFGPQPACSQGESKDTPSKHGCKQIQEQNHMKDTNELAQKMKDHQEGKGEKPSDEELNLCKRGGGGAACAWKPKSKTSSTGEKKFSGSSHEAGAAKESKAKTSMKEHQKSSGSSSKPTKHTSEPKSSTKSSESSIHASSKKPAPESKPKSASSSKSSSKTTQPKKSSSLMSNLRSKLTPSSKSAKSSKNSANPESKKSSTSKPATSAKSSPKKSSSLMSNLKSKLTPSSKSTKSTPKTSPTSETKKSPTSKPATSAKSSPKSDSKKSSASSLLSSMKNKLTPSSKSSKSTPKTSPTSETKKSPASSILSNMKSKLSTPSKSTMPKMPSSPLSSLSKSKPSILSSAKSLFGKIEYMLGA